MKEVDRLTRVNELIKRELAGLLEREREYLAAAPNMLISITGVETSVDLRNAKVYISLFGGDAAARRKTMAAVEAKRVAWQSRMARSLAFKNTPVLVFEQDERLAAGDKVLGLLTKDDPE